MRITSLLLAGIVALGMGCSTAAFAADSDDGALGAMLRRLRENLSGSPLAPPSPPAHAIIGAPEPPGDAITGRVWMLPPSEQFTGREAALRFRFQQQLRSGAWPPPVQPE
jgi:hypothetical protein